MSKVFVNIGLSLDGYMAPEGMTMDNPDYKNWGTKWGAMMGWLINQQSFRENHNFGPGGETWHFMNIGFLRVIDEGRAAFVYYRAHSAVHAHLENAQMLVPALVKQKTIRLSVFIPSHVLDAPLVGKRASEVGTSRRSCKSKRRTLSCST